MLRFLLDADGPAVAVELHHAVSFRIPHVVSKDGGAILSGSGPLQRISETVAVEDVVTENEAAPRVAHEVAPDVERLGKPLWPRLLRIAQAHPPIAAVSQQGPEVGQVVRRRDDEHLPDPRQHQRAERVVDHRLVVDRQKLLADRVGDGIEARSAAPGQDDAFHLTHAATPPTRCAPSGTPPRVCYRTSSGSRDTT